MKKWNEYSHYERGMVIFIIVLLLGVVLSWNRISGDVRKGSDLFFGVSGDTAQTR